MYNPEEAEELLDKYFPKGDKRRGQALVILGMATVESYRQGQDEVWDRLTDERFDENSWELVVKVFDELKRRDKNG